MISEHALCAFADVLGDGDQTALLFNHRGIVRAGMYLDNRGNDVSEEIGAALAGVSVDTTRAMRHLGIGEWRAIVCECADANLAMAPADDGDIVFVAAAPSIPTGFVRRLLDLAARRALAWRREVA